MSLKHINEAFKRMCEAPDFKDVADPNTDLRAALETKMYALMDAQEANIKAYEIGFQDVLENLYPDKAWWEVTNVDIFQHLFMNRNPSETLEAIVADIEGEEDTVEEALHESTNGEWKNIQTLLRNDAEDGVDSLYELTPAGEEISGLQVEVEDAEGVWLEPSIQNGEGGIWIYSSADDRELAGGIDYASFNESVVDIALDVSSSEEFKTKYRDFLLSTIENNPSETDEDDDFYESLKGKLREALSRLNEAPTSPEDQADSDLIRSMLSKMQARSNAAFSPEEKAVLDKYGIKRDNWQRNLHVDGQYLDQSIDKHNNPRKDYGWQRDPYNNGNKSKINYADRARKIPQRTDSQVFDAKRGYARNSDINAHGGSRVNSGNLLDASRNNQNAVMQEPVNRMKSALSDRKYHKPIIDRAQQDYDDEVAKAKAEYERRVAFAERTRADREGGYHRTTLDRANREIDTLLKRDPKTESVESSGYFKVTYDSNGVASAVMVKANSEEEAR